jgi:hypothetical protein
MTKPTPRPVPRISLCRQLAVATGGGGAIGGSTGGAVLGTGGGTSTPPALAIEGGMSGGTGIGGLR